MQIIQDLIPLGRRNRPGKLNPRNYITIHNTGNTSKGADAKAHANYLKSDAANNAPVSWHYTVDSEGAYQHIPAFETAYHAGDGATGTGNAQSIGIEICMNSDGDLLKATDNAAELAAQLCKTHDIPVENIVQHNRWNKKDCPQLIRSGKPYSWEVFIDRVKLFLREEGAITQEQFDEMMDDYLRRRRAHSVSGWAKNSWEKAEASDVTDGTSPQDWATREQVITMLDRLGIIK